MAKQNNAPHYLSHVHHKPILLFGGLFLLVFGALKLIVAFTSIPQYSNLFQTEYGPMLMGLLFLDLATGGAELAAGIVSLLTRKHPERGSLCAIISIVAVILAFASVTVIIFTSDGPTAYRGGRMPLDLLAAVLVAQAGLKLRWLNKNPEYLEEAGFPRNR